MLSKVHDILDLAMSKQVGNVADSLSFDFSLQATWRSRGFTVPFLNVVRETVLPREIFFIVIFT